MARKGYALSLLALVALSGSLGGCSSGEAADAAEAANPAPPRHAAPAPHAVAGAASRPTHAPAAHAAADTTPLGTDSLQRAREIDVMRETFAYQGATRDPFNSLLTGTTSGPDLGDLQLVAVMEDLRVPSNSVVVLREKVSTKRYKMRAGDRLGRMRLAQIRPREAVFMIQDLGFERQETLSLRKQEEATP